eukprot:TRINITY_DN36397_c0_g1_i1.p1 TRINITY_DN36397_c0_g1~~TRINITY_DN36397_c0_g1_i1.p1  ORF type:complete len:946 (-),score=212.40 TRINITY_DN36397_c0_g1_i1:106-2943(-)
MKLRERLLPQITAKPNELGVTCGELVDTPGLQTGRRLARRLGLPPEVVPAAPVKLPKVATDPQRPGFEQLCSLYRRSQERPWGGGRSRHGAHSVVSFASVCPSARGKSPVEPGEQTRRFPNERPEWGEQEDLSKHGRSFKTPMNPATQAGMEQICRNSVQVAHVAYDNQEEYMKRYRRKQLMAWGMKHRWKAKRWKLRRTVDGACKGRSGLQLTESLVFRSEHGPESDGVGSRQPTPSAEGGAVSVTTCTCGNVFLADAVFCRKCGAKRATAETAAFQCVCGNNFLPDSEFCRRCGTSRTELTKSPSPPSPRGSPTPGTTKAAAFRARRQRTRTGASESDAYEERNAVLEERYRSLAEPTRALLEAAYVRHVGGKERSGGEVLQGGELRTALEDFGLRGYSAEEKRELAALCRRKAARGVAEFAFDIVFPCRQILLTSRLADFKRYLCMCSRDWDGLLVFSDLMCALRLILPVECLDESDDQYQQQLRKQLLSEASEFSKSDEGHPAKLVELVQRLGEEKIRNDAERARDIQTRFGLSAETFAHHRRELANLERCFTAVDHDGSGCLDTQEVFKLMEMLGVTPHTSAEKRRQVELLEGVREVDFHGFLSLIGQIRALKAHSLETFSENDFYKLVAGQEDTSTGGQGDQPSIAASKTASKTTSKTSDFAGILDGGPISSAGSKNFVRKEGACLTLDSLGMLLEEQGLQTLVASTAMLFPKEFEAKSERLTQALKEKFMDVLGRILHMLDPEGKELFTFEQSRLLCTYIPENVLFAKNRHEEQRLTKCGFDRTRMHQMKACFDKVDSNEDGKLEKEEVRECLRWLNVVLEPEMIFASTFRMLDEDGNGALDFVEFVTLMKMIRDKEGAFRSDSQPVSTMETLSHVDLVRVLDLFGLAWEQTDLLPRAQLLELACDMMDVGPRVALGSLNVHTIGDVLALATHKTSQK